MKHVQKKIAHVAEAAEAVVVTVVAVAVVKVAAVHSAPAAGNLLATTIRSPYNLGLLFLF